VLGKYNYPSPQDGHSVHTDAIFRPSGTDSKHHPIPSNAIFRPYAI